MNFFLSYRTNQGLRSLSFAENGENEDLVFTVRTGKGGCRLELRPKAALTLERVSAEMSFSFQKDDNLFLNGYQSWTDSRETGVSGRMRGLQLAPKPVVRKFHLSPYGDYDFADYSGKSGRLHGFSYAYVRRQEEFFLLGSLAERDGFTAIYFDTKRNRIVFQRDCAGLAIREPWEALNMAFYRGAEDRVFDAWFSAMEIPAPKAKPVTGFTSWYRWYQNIREPLILDNLAAMKNSGRVPDVFQIDDGYESAVGDWLKPDPVKFPRSMGPVAAEIAAAGMLPGLWMAPFACQFDSETAKNHPDWLLRDAGGKPVVGGGNWGGFWVLDFYNENVRRYLRECFNTVINVWGFRLLKLDFLYAACLCPTAERTRGRIMAETMDFLRDCAGDALILACGVPLSSAFGRVDYCRIGCDVGLDYDDKPFMRLLHRERVSTKNSMGSTIYRRQLSGRAFLNDPDVFFLRDRDIRLTEKQRSDLARVDALFGDVLFTSDNPSEYNDAQLAAFGAVLSGRPAVPAIVRRKSGKTEVLSGGESLTLDF